MPYKCKLYEVTVLLGHNSRRGRRKAPDAIRIIAADNCVHAGIQARRILAGVKEVISVKPASIAELLKRSRAEVGELRWRKEAQKETGHLKYG